MAQAQLTAGVLFQERDDPLPQRRLGGSGVLQVQLQLLVDLHARHNPVTHLVGDYSITDLAELFSISRPAVYRSLDRQPSMTSLPSLAHELSQLAIRLDGLTTRRKIGSGGVEVVVHVGGAETAGAFAVIEQTHPVGRGAPPHTHELGSETLLVVEGTFLNTTAGLRCIIVKRVTHGGPP